MILFRHLPVGRLYFIITSIFINTQCAVIIFICQYLKPGIPQKYPIRVFCVFFLYHCKPVDTSITSVFIRFSYVSSAQIVLFLVSGDLCRLAPESFGLLQ